MKKFCAITFVLIIPFLVVVHLLVMALCVPFIALYATIHQTVRTIKELFDLRNTLAFAKCTIEKAYKVYREK